LGWEEEVEATRLEEDADVVGLEETSDGGHYSVEEEEEDGYDEEGAALDDEVVGLTSLL
jgi:hypothetical protein